MPLHDYLCATCNRPFSLFYRSFSAADAEAGKRVCPLCGGRDLTRIVSKPTLLRGSEHHLASRSDPRGIDAEDPRVLAGLLRSSGEALDQPLEGEMGEIVERLEAGQSAADVGTALDEAPQS